MKGTWYVYTGAEREAGRGLLRLPTNAPVVGTGATLPDMHAGLVSVRRPNWPDGLALFVPASELRVKGAQA